MDQASDDVVLEEAISQPKKRKSNYETLNPQSEDEEAERYQTASYLQNGETEAWRSSRPCRRTVTSGQKQPYLSSSSSSSSHSSLTSREAKLSQHASVSVVVYFSKSPLCVSESKVSDFVELGVIANWRKIKVWDTGFEFS